MGPPTSQEKELLNELRKNIEDLELSEDDLADINLVRFLRARSGNLHAAEVMIRNNQQWKSSQDVKGLLWDWEYPKEWDEEYYYGMVGMDRDENPVLYAPFGRWDIQRAMAQGHKEDFIKYVYHHMERMYNMVRIKSKGGNQMKQAVGLVDLEGLSLRQVTSMDVVEAAIRCLKTFEANYPESIKTAVIVNAPWAFQLIWKVIKPFISEHTHSKLCFVGNDKEKWREAMMKHAEPSQFPELYGGSAPNSRKYFVSRDGSWTISENQNDSDEELDEKITNYGCKNSDDEKKLMILS